MIGCLCIHGFTGAPYEVEPLADYFKKSTDWDVQTITLPGHGDTLALKGISFQEWLACAEIELVRMLKRCDELYIIGFSMGGMIAAYLAAKYPVKKLVLLSAAALYINPRQFIADLAHLWKDSVRGTLAENIIYSRYKKKFLKTPISSAFQFQKLVKATKPALKSLELPVLIVQGECDAIVPVSSARFLYNTIPSLHKELYLIPDCKHHVCLEENAGQLFKHVERFFE
ncbi:alpha/beta fold hydrolase [Bacillus gobiensis]|uniref:alpha/beta hydrolase n=1 Tax=Bacillus gobiensis TaxID=1441095 RepID=UPI003D1EABC7